VLVPKGSCSFYNHKVIFVGKLPLPFVFDLNLIANTTLFTQWEKSLKKQSVGVYFWQYGLYFKRAELTKTVFFGDFTHWVVLSNECKNILIELTRELDNKIRPKVKL